MTNTTSDRAPIAQSPPQRYTNHVAEPHITLERDPVIEAYKKDIDRTLLRENLKLTPAQRLQKLHRAVRGAVALREAYLKTRR
jgi:hypothetical protein